MTKGISTIIATIMLVVITIGLISTAYLYFTSIVTVGPVLSVAYANCNSSKVITAALRNDGTSAVSTDSINWFLDGNKILMSSANCTVTSLNAGNTTTCTITTSSGLHNLLAIGPKNQAGGPVTCP